MIYMNFNNGEVIMTKANNYKSEPCFTVIYGLQVKTHKTNFNDAMTEFNDCVNHARSCEGL